MKATLFVLALLAAGEVAAQDAAGRNLAASCAICHGTEGRAVTQDMVSLAGLPKERIAGQMQAFRSGQRPATVMHLISRGYSDAQIDAIAAWFAVQKPQAAR